MPLRAGSLFERRRLWHPSLARHRYYSPCYFSPNVFLYAYNRNGLLSPLF